ncbi:hypothetical protein TVAG_388490 [Trichomonas vaginalis G3]|uniref:DUF3447 domain-containing protein n=1 Tax=Trichomonas vaginalis (strain ATCC PRA-98 / G3) TaxID=412133 RepID=A2DYI3_TRIV3|nr:protein ubiquitination [Trichomonas vaginalis G3]EAY14518.1 hypothetical protein TVAG_388490 [Trichomonas vaginalis G3]KAI5529309.1 protein ubiquitination [Trichomonas vaginalis G3]|eukprot:XP_001326741.1 hypothetical protein [Trichomonas vaginalis G3]
MSEKDIPKKYNELRSIYKDYIDVYNLLYQLKTENEEELNSIYIMIKTELTESIKLLPQNIIRDISNMVPYNNRYTKSYLLLAKFISDEYHVTNVRYVEIAFNFLFYKEYGIKLDKSSDFEEIKSLNLDIHTENTIYRAIMNDDKETFISCTEREGFNRYQTLKSKLYPKSKEREELRSYIYSCSDRGYSLLELCCYHGAVDCFKFLRTKFKSEITQKCLQLSFLGRSKEIMSECLKHKKPDEECMKYAIISHNIDFVTFLMNEYKKKIDVYNCRVFKNLESFLVYYDQIHNYHRCIVHSAGFTIPSLLEYFISHGGFINKSDKYGETSLHYAARYNSKEIAERLLSRGANINKKDNSGKTALHIAAMVNSKEVAELLLSRGANINERDNSGKTALHIAASKNSKETLELLISCGANINEKANSGKSALRIAVWQNHKEIVEVLIAYGANINEKK